MSWGGRKEAVIKTLVVIVGLGALMAGFCAYQRNKSDVPIGALQAAAAASAADQVIATEVCQDERHLFRVVCRIQHLISLRQEDEEALADHSNAITSFQQDIEADWWLVAGYGIGLVLIGFSASSLLFSRIGRRLAKTALWMAPFAALSDFAENRLVLKGLGDLKARTLDDTAWEWASALAAAKFALLFVAFPVAMAAGLVLLKRPVWAWIRNQEWITTEGHRRRKNAIVSLRGNVDVPWPVVAPEGTRWPSRVSAIGPVLRDREATAHYHYSGHVPSSRKPALTGFCVSGGGIRSACVTLGALQSLREYLLKARYLISVSGGGYTAGSMQLCLNPKPVPGQPGTRSAASPQDVLEPGSVEEDHVRRHGSYIADGAKEWMNALWVLLRGLLVSLTLLTSTALVIGLFLSAFFRTFPVVDLSRLDNHFTGSAPSSPPFPEYPGYVGWSLLVTVALATFLWFIAVAMTDQTHLRRLRRGLKRISGAMTLVGALLAALVIVAPLLGWAATFLAGKLREGGAAPEAIGGVGGTIVLTYLGSLAAILWRKREQVGGVVKGAGKFFGLGKKSAGETVRLVPQSLTQKLIVWATLLVITTALLLALGVAIATGTDWPRGFQIGLPLVLLGIHLGVDQTWLSLHPFYRRRLASAFAVRRVGLGGRDWAARPYDFDSETTSLADYGRPCGGFPQVIFAGAANVSGPDRAPSGRRAVSFTMSHDYVGGPDIGYVPTLDLEQLASGPLGADLTVQAAVAVSGAAFASAMGRQARPFQTLLAISNARLGTWLPNPWFVHELTRNPGRWWIPGLPRVRRMTYLLREIFGYFSHEDRLLLVTDGGHYDNLGLVETLRHKCKLIFCIDATGDSPPFPETLTEAIALAKEELGIEITIIDPFDLVPGSTEPLEPSEPLDELSKRLARSPILVGRVEYPEAIDFGDGRPTSKGVLIFAKAVLTAEIPFDLLAYAQSEPVFPRDSTGDQWFTHEQFDAYQALGSAIGLKAAETADKLKSSLGRGLM